MSCNRALNGALALLVTVLAGTGPAMAQEKAGEVISPPSAAEEVVQYRKGWEPKAGEADALDIDTDEPGSFSDTARMTDKSAKARPVLGALQRSGAVGTVDLRNLLPGVPFKRDRERRENEGPPPHPILLPGTEGTPSAQEQPPGGGVLRAAPNLSAPAPAPIASFDGLDYTFAEGYPPDNNGDVGPAHYIESVNTSIGIFDKATGTRLVGLSLDAFMSQGAFGNLCDSNNYGDPVVLYDSFEDRWIITDFAFATDASGNVTSDVYQCFAVSRTGDPVAGGWYFYSDASSDALPDYPKFGVWTDGIYRSANNFGPGTNGGSFIGARAWAYNKAQMYAGAATVQIVQFDNPDATDFSLQPSNARLQTGTPPAGRPNYFVSLWQYLNSQNVYAFKVDWNRPSLSTFTLVGQPTASSSWANANPPTNPTPKNALDSLGIRAMMQNQYTNIGGAESLWNSHTVRRTTSGSNVPRWYQINVTGGTVASSDVQSTNWDPDAANTNYRWMSSAAVDRAGNMAIGYSLSNATTNPKIMYAGRLAGDPINTFSQTEQTLIAGTGAQTGNCGSSTCTRWGDYTAMSLDPDGCTFWYVNEYYTSNDLHYRTRIGSFRYPSCTMVGNGGTISGTVTASAGGAPIGGATVKLGSRVATTDALGLYSFTVPAGTYPVEIASAAGYNDATATSLVVTDSGTTTQNFSLSAAPASACYTDTTQSDFQTAASTNIDLASSPGDAMLTSTTQMAAAKQETDSGSGYGFTNTSWAAQTFTATATGQLTSADIGMFCNACSGTNPNITVSVRASTGGTNSQTGLPTGSDLASGTIAGFNDGGAGGLHTVTFGTPISVTAGTQYALVLRATATRTGSYIYSVSNTTGANPYAGGRNSTSTNSGGTWAFSTGSNATRSLVFHAYVTIPRTYSAAGSLTSSAKDANPAPGYTPTWATLNWTGTTPASTTLRFQAAGSNAATGPFNFVGPDGTASTYFSTGDSLSQFNGDRYVKYRASFATSNTANSPVLSDVSLCSTNTPPTPVATKLAFTTQPPASSNVGAAFSVQVSVEDASGNVVTTDSSAVTLSLSGGTAGATLGGTTTVNAVNGVATFSNLSVNTAGTAYQLNATDGSLAGAASNAFNIVPNTYTIGGNVSGLTTSGLVLAVTAGSQTLSVASGASSYVFPTAVVDGSPYTVSVQTQPAGQTCSVANPTGAVSGGNVTNADVSCTTNSYTIGGTVSGLTTSGLVMAVTAGSQTLSVASGASSYVFANPVLNGSTYTVSVQTQPAGQTCTVANPSGTVSAANVTNADVTCTNNNYTIGGSVTGLTASGLVMAVTAGSQTVNVASGASSYVFPTAVPNGSSYTVSVQTQPTGQTCSVANPTGAVSAGNVTNANVTCTTNTYTVGGSISGLTGSVSLKLVGTTPPSTQTQTFATTGGFTFTTPLVYGSGWTVSVATQPTGQTCTVTNGSGTNLNASVSTVQVTCTTNSYTIGGGVTGLSATGLVMAVTSGSQTVSVASGASSYVFPSAVLNGSTYIVSVQTQPTGQTCTVANPSGTISAANVTNANVTCTTNSYTIGGGVTGLSATGLVMAVTSGSQTVSVASGASSYVFPSAVLNGSTYIVSVQTQPTGQTCTVANPSGTISAANVTNANVTCTTNMYSVGGNISGLTGSVSLKLDSTNPTTSQAQPFTTTGSFTFASTLAYGSGWTVSVAAQPTGQTCSVTNGSGTNLSGNVSTVQVTCTTNTYTIGGAVGGLTGSNTVGLKLTDTTSSTSQTIASQANGSFTFGTALNFGDGWNVTVATQPTGQTCSITNGSGTNLSANVTNVSVTCTTNTYTIGGVVGGLTGSNTVGLKLTDTTSSTTQTIASQANGSFTFGTALNFGDGWNVTVATQPTGQTCSVTNGSGTNLSGNVTNVSVTCTTNTYTLTYSAGAHGSLTGTTSQTVSYGANGTPVTAIPATDYHFVQWSDGSTANPRTDTNVTASLAVTATFAANVLVFTTQPANLVQGGQLGTIAVAVQDGSGNTLPVGGTADFTIAACGGSVDLGSVTISNGVATLSSTLSFHTIASGLTVKATSGSLSAVSAPFSVGTNTDLVFENGFDGCRL